MKIDKIWIYEYKDDDTPVGATFFLGTQEQFLEELSHEMKLPHLNSEWHWRISIVSDYEDKNSESTN